ncbi:hypothetical protein HJC23_004550 [Cyclotella cryptica]|uniref:Bromo domain-containing protein n=1 Tax=Cyclotella cryptica TaxID=29204 RepID=A0ABD3QA64_9STRA
MNESTWVRKRGGGDGKEIGFNLEMESNVTNPGFELVLSWCHDGTFQQQEQETNQHTTLEYHLVPLPPPAPDAEENNMEYLAKKDSRSGIEPFWNHSVHVPNKSLICPSPPNNDSESGYALQLPLVYGTVVGYSPPWNKVQEEYDINDDDMQQCQNNGEYPPFEFESHREKDNEALFRILWDGSAHGIGYLEDVTLKELLPCLLSSKKKKKDGSNATPLPTEMLPSHAMAVHKQVRATLIRKRLSVEWKMENDILPRLVVLAALELRREIAQKVRLELLLERRRLRAVAVGVMTGGVGGENGKKKTKKRGGETGEMNADGNEFEYYLKHPNQYMSSFQPPPPLPSDDEGDEDDDGGEHSKPRSKTKLTKDELIRYNEKVDEQCHFAPSKIAERVKLASSMAFNYVSRKGLLDEYFAECERRKEMERVSREEMDKSFRGGVAARGAGAVDGEVRRSARARNTVNYADDATQVVDSILEEHEGISRAKANGRTSEMSCEYPRKDVSGGPTAIYLLGLLGWNSEDESTENGTKSLDEEGEDPFFEPDPCLVIDQLGRKQRYMSPANIQDAIVRTIEGEPIETPQSLLDDEQVEEIENTREDRNSGTYVSDIICTSDDKIPDLPQYEPASFARCRFATRTYIPEQEEIDGDGHEVEMTEEEIEAEKRAKAEARVLAKKRKEERQKIRMAAEQRRNAKLEQLYRSRKTFELWRFKSIHGNGCTVWPLWSDRSKSLLKDLFVISRVNSTADLVASGQPVVETEEKTQPTAESTSSVDQPTHSDEALARSLAAAENFADDNEPLAKRRRTTRRAAGGGEEPVFYGSYQSMSRDQLLSTLVRLLRLAKPGSSSIMDLKQLVFATDYESSRGEVVEWRKLRSALGHLVFRLGQVGRLLVDVDGDSACWELLKEGALVKFTGDGIASSETNEAPPDTSLESSSDAVTPSAAASALLDGYLIKKLSALEDYVQNLHLTELSLRRALMKAIDKGGQSGESLLQISTIAIATAADEMEGDAVAEDWRFFNTDDGKDSISWKNSDNALIGKIIFRPSSSPLIPSNVEPGLNQKCQWYRVVSFTPSMKGATTSEDTNKQSQDLNALSNTVVARRMRFRAIPIPASDIDATPSDVNMDLDVDNNANDIDYMVLTESQVRAGMEAAILHRKICAGSQAHEHGSAKRKWLNEHPFKNKTGSRVMLTPHPLEGEKEKYEIIYGVIAGHNHLVESKIVTSKLLILLDHEEENEEESCAFWSTVNADGTLLTDIVSNSDNVPPLCRRYKIDMHEYFQGSEAYNVCASILNHLKSHQKSAPFSTPVDPVALDIPDYFDVIKNPMDLSTVAKNLEEGKYSRIPPNYFADEDDVENPIVDHPVYKMAYGPFYNDVMLIFDNAILYNSAESWIGKEAEVMKKNAIRKFDQSVKKATALWFQPKSKGAHAKKNMYAEEDSDVDMYEYESDYDDEDGKTKSRKGGTKKLAKPRVQEDIPSKAIEKPYMLPENVVDFNVSGSFPHMKIQTSVGRFSLPHDWSCRHAPTKTGASGAEANESEVDDEEEEMLSLMKIQQEEEANVRRSSRARTAPKAYYTDDELVSSNTRAAPSEEPICLPGVEYYIMNDDCFQLNSESSSEPKGTDSNHCRGNNDSAIMLPTTSQSRVGVEGVRETLHEQFYAKLYRQHSPNAMILESEFGKYVEGSFPPYLGRVFDTSSDKNSGSIVWEIREQYVLPALRWVLRGLVRSGHLAEVDGSLSEGISPDNDGSTGARAGVSFTFSSGVVVPNHEYYFNEQFEPFEVLDEKEILRQRRLQSGDGGAGSSDEEEVELSAYEKMRAERVARNAERLKALGLA